MEDAVIPGEPATIGPSVVPHLCQVFHLPAEAPASCVKHEGARGVGESCHDPPDEISQPEIRRCWRREGDTSLPDLSDLNFLPFPDSLFTPRPHILPPILRFPFTGVLPCVVGSTMRAEHGMHQSESGRENHCIPARVESFIGTPFGYFLQPARPWKSRSC